MKHEIFLKLLQGTDEDIQIACNWLVEHHDPMEYINNMSNTERISSIGVKAFKFSDISDNKLFIGNGRLYYKYADKRMILVSKYGISVTDCPYTSSIPVVNH